MEHFLGGKLMLAIRVYDYGNADQLVLEETPQPKPAKGKY